MGDKNIRLKNADEAIIARVCAKSQRMGLTQNQAESSSEQTQNTFTPALCDNIKDFLSACLLLYSLTNRLRLPSPKSAQ
jgi:hypothetical protein